MPIFIFPESWRSTSRDWKRQAESIGAATPLNMADIWKSTAVLVKALFAEDCLGKHVSIPWNFSFQIP